MPPGSRETLTLVFGLGALERLADPATAVDESHAWSSAVAVSVLASERRAEHVLGDAETEPDVLAGGDALSGSLAIVRQRSPTERHVYVGTGQERGIAEALGWEFVPFEEAAEAAGWTLDGGLSGRPVPTTTLSDRACQPVA